MVISKRAVTEGAKLRKKEHILFTAHRCFEKLDFNDLKMVDIAKEAGVAKGTLFNYFKTKEHLFLEMLYQECEQRFFNTKRMLTTEKGHSISDFKSFIIKEMNPLLNTESSLIKLIAIKSAVLEVNLDSEIAIEMDKLFKVQRHQICKEITYHFDGIKLEDIMETFIAQEAFIIGYYHLTKKSNNAGCYNDITEFKQKSLHSMKYFMDGYFSEWRRN